MSTILADLDVIAARQRQVEAENQNKINTLEDENVKLMRERGDIAKRIQALKDLRLEQRNMLVKINKLNNVSESVDDFNRPANVQQGVSSSVSLASVQSTFRSAMKNESSRPSNISDLEPSHKRAKNGQTDPLNEDFIPFNSTFNNNLIRNNNDSSNGGVSSRFNANANGSGSQTGRPTQSGQNDLAQKSKEALVRRARENAARRKLVDNPCTYFSQAGNCKNGSFCVMSHDVVPAQYCGEYNEVGSCHRRDCRLRHELFEYTPPNVRRSSK